MNTLLRIHEKDNVATCLGAVLVGESCTVNGVSLIAKDGIPQYHKIALTDIPLHGEVYKYGQVIGFATEDISAGEHVHIHNIESARGRGDRKGE